MALIKCTECGKEISDKAVSCPNCGAPSHYNEQAQATIQMQPKTAPPEILKEIPNKKKEKIKDSVLSIIAAVFALFTISALIGFIIAIIDLAAAKNEKVKERHLGSYFAIVYTILIFVVIFFPSNKQEQNANAPIQQTSIENDISNSLPKQIIEEKHADNKDTYIESNEIYNENDVVIKVQGYNSDINYITIPFLIENNSALNLGFNAHAYSINKIMTGNNIYDMNCDVAAGKKANVELKIKKEILDKYSIDIVKSVDILFWAYDKDKSYKAFDTGQITIQTNKYDGNFDYVAGKIIYENKNIKVEYLSNSKNEYTYCVTNNTGDYLCFDVENITINDYTSSKWDFDLMSVIVLNSCQSVITIRADDKFMKLNNISDIEKIEFSLNIRPLEDYFSDWSTDMILSEDF